MIRSFGDGKTRDIWDGKNTSAARKVPPELWNAAHRKLDMLHAAHEPRDLRIPPGNRLEKLHDKSGELYSIRINDQFRVVFRWTQDGADGVRITDYR
ncbi:MAG: type II toxin-antitoxin system RelE/ParE family toxin [Elusimicrobia bacterium]|nr:type II toxin-antitoxin system RelE/ParE family toxin [Elusimicrobiota bacterium]